MGCWKSSSKKEVYNDTVIPQETRKKSNRQPNFTPKTTGKIRTNTPPPRGMVWGGRTEEDSGWGTHVYLWQINFNIWQNQYNIIKLKNKIKLQKKPHKNQISRSKEILKIWAETNEKEMEKK